MTVMSFAAVIVPRTGGIIKNGISGENLLQKCIHFVFKLSQSLEIVFQS